MILSYRTKYVIDAKYNELITRLKLTGRQPRHDPVEKLNHKNIIHLVDKRWSHKSKINAY